MRKLIGIALFACLVSLIGVAQETPKPEVFGGYQFTSMGLPAGQPRWNASGWDGSASMYINRWFGVTGDFSGAYNGQHFMTYTGGPVVSTHQGPFSPFVHALFGGAHASASSGGVTVSTNGMAMMFGGGVDIGKKQLALRLGQFDWMLTRFNGVSQNNNIRLSTGVLFRF